MPHQQLFQNIFQKNTWEHGNATMLQQEAEKYPYFSPIHFFLLKETGEGNNGYKKIAAKTALHFSNPHLLQIQLRKKEEKAIVVEMNKEKIVEQIEKEDIIKTFDNITFRPIVDETLLTSKEPEKQEELLFEPLHMSDYFASQGIKLSEEVQPGDKLGKQLKSFTEWLKDMKKSHGNKMPENNNSIDALVQKLAEKSNKEEDVITEAMAEVYIQQGKRQKAHEIYEKLSLLNPSKSAYFAAKIEFLNDK